MARTPEQWLEVLAKRLDARLPYINLMRRYSNGDAPLPEMGRNVRPSWEAFQRKSLTNVGGFVVAARCDRIVYSGVTVAGSVDSVEAKAAARIVRDNRLDVAFSDAVANSQGVGYGYLAVGTDGDGKAVVTSELPELMIVAQDPIQSWRARAALKVWRDLDYGFDHAAVWADGAVHPFRRPSSVNGNLLLMASTGGWLPDGDPVPFGGPFPVFELENEVGKSASTAPFVGGLSILDSETNLIDSIHHTKLLLDTTMGLQTFRQRAIKIRKDSGGLPDVDPNGNKIDYGLIFEPAPGAMWELPEEVEDIWESQQTSIADMSTALKDKLRLLGAITGAMMPGVASDSENQTAEGARSGKEGLAGKASKFLQRARPVFNGAMVAALRVEGFPAEATVDVKFEPTDRVTLAEKMDAASKAIAAGMSIKTVQRDILGWSPDQIAEDERDRRQASAQSLIAKLPAAAQPAA